MLSGCGHVQIGVGRVDVALPHPDQRVHGRAQAPLEPLGRPDPPGEHLDLRRALGRVPTEARVLLALRYVDGLSYGELAKIRGISINTVKSQLQRGKGLLRAALI